MTDSEDLRRRQYIPVATHFHTGRTGSRILDEFGLSGLGVWVALLATCKKGQIQGTLVWLSEADAWSQLGLRGFEPEFTFQEFVTVLGKIKQARTRRIGRENETILTRFSDWNKTIPRQLEAERMRRKRAQFTPNEVPNDPPNVTPTVHRTEGEGEYKSFKTSRPQAQELSARPSPAANGKPVPRTDPDEYTCEWCGTRQRNKGELEDHLEYVHAANEWLRDNNPDSPLYQPHDPYLTREQ